MEQKKVGKLIEEIMLENGFTSNSLAKKIGVSQSQLYKVIYLEKKINIEIGVLLSKHFELDLDFFLLQQLKYEIMRYLETQKKQL